MSSPTFRRKIIEALDVAIWAAFNSVSGSTEKVFRGHDRGILKPAKDKNMPCYTLSDGGQRAATEADARTEASGERIMTVRLTLQIASAWDRVSNYETWSDRVEKLIALLLDTTPVFGVIEMRYVDDDPVDVVFMRGESSAGWEIEFEVHRFVDE